MGLPQRFYTGTALTSSADVSALAGGYSRPGVVWGVNYDHGYQGSGNNPVRPTVTVLCDVNAGAYARLWAIDSADGSEIRSERATWNPLAGTATKLVAEPPGHVGSSIYGAVWRFGTLEDAAYGYGGPTVIDIENPGSGALAITSPSNQDPDPTILLSDYSVTGTTSDFAIDRTRNRIFIRGSAMNAGTVNIYNFTTHALIASVTVPDSPTVGIVPTGEDEHVWIVGSSGWLCRYTYDGVPSCSLRNPRAAVVGGFAYGWDYVHRRLLMLEADTANLRVRGFWPYPAPVGVSGAVPIDAALKNDTISVCANVFDDAGLGVSSRLAVTTTGPAGTPGPEINVLSDADGDIVRRDTPPTAGVAARRVIVTVSGSDV